jgi:hypothetical protein
VLSPELVKAKAAANKKLAAEHCVDQTRWKNHSDLGRLNQVPPPPVQQADWVYTYICP